MMNTTKNTLAQILSRLNITSISWLDVQKWLLLVISVFLIMFVYQKTLNPLIENRTVILKQAYYIKELQNSILDTVTLSQIKNAHHFNQINIQLNALDKSLQQLTQNPAILNSPKLLSELKEIIKKSKLQNKYIERLKSEQAVIHNSFNYLPTAFKSCFKNISASDSQFNSPENINLIQTLFNEAIASTHSLKAEPTVDLKRYLTQFHLQGLDTTCKSLMRHGNIFVKTLSEHSKNLIQLNQVALSKAVHNFYLSLEEQTSQAVNTNKFYYAILSMLAFLLIAYTAFALISSYRINAKLSGTLNELSEQQGLFTTLIKVNSAISTINDQTLVFQTVCDIICKEASIDSSWIGIIDEDSYVKPIIAAGSGKQVILKLKSSINPSTKEGTGIIAGAYKENSPVITNNFLERMRNTPWKKIAEKWGVKGGAALPLRKEGKIIGFLVTYTGKHNFFTPKKNELLIQLANDLNQVINRFALEENQKKQQQDLAISAIAFESHEAILIANAHKKIIRVNHAFTSLTGYSAEEVLGKKPSIIKSGLHDKRFYQDLWRSIDITGKWQGEIWNRKKDGTLYPSWQTISACYDDNNHITNYISHSLDLTRDKESQREIHYLNNHDTLTKLPNRNLLIDRLEQQLGQNNSQYSYLFLININRFKIFNESLGHKAADELLIKVAQRLKKLKFDNIYNMTVSRIGSDEFGVLCLTDFDEQSEANIEAGHTANIIQKMLSSTFNVNNNNVVIDTSIGVTLFTPSADSDHAKTAENLLQEANTALHRAKQSTLNSIQFFEPKMQQQAQQRLALESELRNALANKEFILHYQPQKSLSSSKIVGMEALIRWQNSIGKLVPPSDFVSVLEETGLINPVGTWIIEEAITQAKVLHLSNPDLVMSVNLSAIQFNDKHLVHKVQKLIERLEYPANKLEFEITESLLMTDIEQTLEKLNQLAEIGIKIAIDDFGTGYSSLAYLKRFPVNRLKIDKSFIDDITDPTDADFAIVQATIQMAQSLHIDTIAEGVETSEQLSILKTLECNEIQGYHYSKPLPFDQLVEFIQKQ
jgi:diguanylate cyclase (GGDEF)-like protein/PAS domain S-box-containing protein